MKAFTAILAAAIFAQPSSVAHAEALRAAVFDLEMLEHRLLAAEQ